MLTKIINEETKECLVINQEIAKHRNDLFDVEVEQGYEGNLYLKGFAPEKPQEVKEQEVRAVRNSYLVKYVDPKQLVLVWNSLTEDEQKEYMDYRKYLLDYPETEGWYENPPKDFSTWKERLTEDLEEIIAGGD